MCSRDLAAAEHCGLIKRTMNPEMLNCMIRHRALSEPQLADFFEFEACRSAKVGTERIADATPTEPKRKARQSQRFEISTGKKDSADK